jgi:multidrug efflux pump subunit AcrB/outer membrane protein TolC
MHQWIKFFCGRPLIATLVTGSVLISGILAWQYTSKEELPDITFNTVRILTTYPGASASDVEFYITRPIEEAVQNLDGINEITSQSRPSNSIVSISFDHDIADMDRIQNEIQNQLSRISFPPEITSLPQIRVFDTSKKAIIDIAIYDTTQPLLSNAKRLQLQEIVRSLETRMVAQPEIFELRRTGYLKEEMTITAHPTALMRYEIPLSKIATEIQHNHIRAPSGTLQSGQNEQVSIISELTDAQSLANLSIQGGFDSPTITLGKLAYTTDSFEPQVSIYKVNGYEAIVLNVVKSSRHSILDAIKRVESITRSFRDNELSNTTLQIALMDDESIDVRNRLEIVSTNGLIGLILIVITLFIFLDKQSGFWVAMGIPFTLSFTLVASYLLGYSINGVTLAAIIIVLGIVVDDAIIVAENINQKFRNGLPLNKAVIEGTLEVASPIFASVLTTCIAFLPLCFFSGRFGQFVIFIPPIIFLMLGSSLLESFLLLPAHIGHLTAKVHPTHSIKNRFYRLEQMYKSLLFWIIPKRYRIGAISLILLTLTIGLCVTQFKFVLFPNEESREIVISGIVTDAVTAKQTAIAIQPIERILADTIGNAGVVVRSRIASGRGGSAGNENQFSITLELTPRDQRDKTTNQLIAEIKPLIRNIKAVSEVNYRRKRFGQDSGSTFEVVIAENNDQKRDQLTKAVVNVLNSHSDFINVEEDIVPTKQEYIVSYDQTKLKQLSVNPAVIASTLRTILNGTRLYTFTRNDEIVEVKLSVDTEYRRDINTLLNVPVPNSQNYLIPLRELISITPETAKSTIRHHFLKRASFIYADLKPDATQSPLELARQIESESFPKLLAKFPSAQLYFKGEVIDTTQSRSELITSIMVSLGLIYIVLAMLFNSWLKPFRIMLIIPFGVIGVIFTFYLHGKTQFGFYAAIGTLGMIGVVINDAIVMLSKLDRETTKSKEYVLSLPQIAQHATTRLRAICLTTLTTVMGVLPTAYGLGGLDVMLSDMMLALGWGLIFGTLITLILTPCIFQIEIDLQHLIYKFNRGCHSLITKSRRLISTLLFCTIISIFPHGIHATITEVSLTEFIKTASQTDTQFHAILIDQHRVKYGIPLSVNLPEFHLSLLSSYSLNSPTTPPESRLSLTQTFPQIGQQINVILTSDPHQNAIDTVQLQFSQDIARNAFGKANQLDLAIQGIKNEVVHYQIIEAYEAYMSRLLSLYYTWMRAYATTQLAASAVSESNKVLTHIRKRHHQNVANQTDVNKLELQLIEKQQMAISTEKNYAQTTTQIRRIMGLTQNIAIRPANEINCDPLPKKSALMKNKLAQNRSFIIFDLINAQAQRQTDRDYRHMLPAITVSAIVDTITNQSGQIAMHLDLPVNKPNAKAHYAVSKINAEKTVLTNQSLERDLEAAIQSVYMALVYQKQLIDTAKDRKTLSAAILVDETENYTYGKIGLNDYIQAVNRFDQTRFDEINQKITFQQLSVEFKQLTDQLITALPESDSPPRLTP